MASIHELQIALVLVSFTFEFLPTPMILGETFLQRPNLNETCCLRDFLPVVCRRAFLSCLGGVSAGTYLPAALRINPITSGLVPSSIHSERTSKDR
jgi:hypothetical protein